MVTKLDTFRVENPAYKDVPDDVLAEGLFKKFYAGSMERREFDHRMGINPYDTLIEATGTAVMNAPARIGMGIAGIEQMSAEKGQEGLPELDMPPEQYADNLTFQLWSADKGMIAAEAATDPAVREQFSMEVGREAAINSLRGQLHFMQAKEQLAPVDVAPDSLEQYVSGAIGSVAEMAPGLALSILARNPAPAMIAIGAQVGGTSYAEAREKGLDPRSAREYAALYAAAEAIPEALPLAVLLKPGTKFLTRLIRTMGAEAVQESVTEALQVGIDMGYLQPDMSWGEALDRVKDAAIMGAIAGPIMGAVAHPANQAVDATYGAVEKGAAALRNLLPKTVLVREPKPTEPTMVDRINTALTEKGFAPIAQPEPIVELPEDENAPNLTAEAPPVVAEPTVPAIVEEPTPAPAAEELAPIPPAEVVAEPEVAAEPPIESEVVAPSPTGEPITSPSNPAPIETAQDLETVGAEVNAEPTPAQAEAGNYKKGHVNIDGLDITIESPKGATRKGTAPDGSEWSVEMPAHYGYIKRTTGADGEQVDVYIGENPTSGVVFVVDQLDADTGKFDEHKAILGAESVPEAKLLYEAGFSDGKGAQRIGNITGMTMPGFKRWLAEGDSAKPVGKVVQPKVEKAKAETPATKPDAKPATAEDRARDVDNYAGELAMNTRYGQIVAALERQLTDAKGARADQIRKRIESIGYQTGTRIPESVKQWEATFTTRYGAEEAKAIIEEATALAPNYAAGMAKRGPDDALLTDVEYLRRKFRRHAELFAGLIREDASDAMLISAYNKEIGATWQGGGGPGGPSYDARPNQIKVDETVYKGKKLAAMLRDMFGDPDLLASAPTDGEDDGQSEPLAEQTAEPPAGVPAEQVPPVEAGGETGDVSGPGSGRGSPAGGDAAQPGDDGGRGDNGGDAQLPADAGTGTGRASGPDGAGTPVRTDRSGLTAADYRIEAPEDIGAGGAVAKFEGNIKAIEIVKALAGRVATSEEKAALARYVGWGGLQQAFKRPDGTYADGWEKRAKQLEQLLDPEEFETARQSTQYAHYTSPEIVNGIWKAVQHLGFTNGRVLEPSVGTGNFLGLRPVGLDPQFHAVEFDGITAAIAKALYGKARVLHQGFQDFDAPDGYYDLAIGNPPFGSQKLYDPKRPKLNDFSIHNMFFAKSVDLLRADGVLGMVVTSSFLDAVVKDKARSYIAARTEFLGAIRLPNNAFSKNAGTEVTTDIVFLRRLRPDEQPHGETWIATEYVADPAGGEQLALNEYFVRHPEMMLGTFGRYGTMYGRDGHPALIAKEGQNTAELMTAALARLPTDVMGDRTNDVVERSRAAQVDKKIKAGSMFIDANGNVAINTGIVAGETTAEAAELTGTALERAKGLIGIRDVLVELRGEQLSDGANMEELRALLNKSYDAFVKVHGPISADANRRVFGDDPTWPQLAALEDTFDKGVSPTVAKRTGEAARAPTATKAAIFTKRTQSPYKAPTSTKSAKDALTASLSVMGKIDLDYMSQLYGQPEEAILAELAGLVFETPDGSLETRDAYLTGNVKAKLKAAQAAGPKFAGHVEALEAVQPPDVEAADIEVRPGAHWIPPKYVGEFIDHITQGKGARAYYVRLSGQWEFSVGSSSPAARIEFGTDRADISRIIGAALSQKAAQVYDKNPDGTQTLNQAATEAATEKAAKVAQAWTDWIFEDDARRRDLSTLYNELFNTTIQREFDGSHLQLPGKVGNDIIRLRPHQLNGVWRILQSDTTLLDHVVGAGKTYTMVAAAMELRRTGFAKKPLLTVPNHLVGQWAEDFLRLYPGARILAATKKDFEAKNRKKLFARIATGDWDAIIIGHSSIGRIDLDKQFQIEFLREQVTELEAGIAEIKLAGGKDTRTVKQAEKQREALEERMKRLADTGRKDDNLTFQELGIDALLLDEAHEFKNLFYITGMRSVMGLGNPAGSQKAMDMFMKVRAVQKRTGGRNIVFATGTPISNTMAEMFTMQRYLDYEDMRQRGVLHFDAWARQFADATPDWELSPTGAYKLVTRFRRFVNMPELMQRYQAFSDVITRDDINRQLAAQGKKLPIPKITGGKPLNTVVERSDAQATLMSQLVYRAENMPKRPEKGGDNMLAIMSDARKGALDMRLVDPNAADYPGSKANVMIGKALALWRQWDKQRGAQLIFIDLSTPKAAKGREAQRIRDLITQAEAGDEAAQEAVDKLSPDEIAALDSDFSVYDDVKAKLIAKGVPEAEIAFIHDANTELQKEELFGKVRSGRVRFLLGSTPKMGAGMNVQERLVALHHLDAPWRPSDLEQREGRIIRQGNSLYTADPDGFEVGIFRYATDQTLDSRMWQTIEQKATFIEQVRKGVGGRVIEDVSAESMNAAEMKAASSGNPDILAEMTLRKRVRTLENQRREHQRDQARVKDTIERLTKSNEYLAEQLPLIEEDAKIETGEFVAKIGGESFEKPSEAGVKMMELIDGALKDNKTSAELGTIFGVPVSFQISKSLSPYVAVATKRELTFDIGEKTTALSLVMSIRRSIRELPAEAEQMKARIEAQEADIPKLREKLGPWLLEDEHDAQQAAYDEVVKRLRAPKGSAAAQRPATPEAVEAMSAAQVEEAETASDTSALAGADQPMPKYVATYSVAGVPQRPASGNTVNVGNGLTISLPELDKPMRREGVRTRIEDIVGTRLYYGKIKGQSRLGFYRRSNSEIRLRNYDDIEVMAHEMAHYLDFHYEHRARFASARLSTTLKDEIKQLSYTSDPAQYVKEGFAEYVRLWITNYPAAIAAVPSFTTHFEAQLAADKVLDKKMRRLQEDAHKWFFQGAHAQLRAKSGEEYTPSEAVIRYFQSYPAERLRQETIDKIHAAKVVERTLNGGIADATRSAYKQFQMVNGAESLHESIVKDGTIGLTVDGSFLETGIGLTKVFWPVAKHGWKRFDLLMDYFKARRGNELMRQGRENLFTKEEITAGLDLARQYPEFAQVFGAYQEFNSRMLDFFEQMGLLTYDQRDAFAQMNANYVPFHRVGKMIEEGNRGDGASRIGARLKGGTQNIRDVAENIIEGLFANIRAALIARAKATLYRQILKHQDGSLFAARIGTDSKLVKVRLDEMANTVAKAMADLGLGISKNGLMVNQPQVQNAVYDVADIADVLRQNPDMLSFWMLNQPPKTDGDTYVDSAVIDGERVWMEVREPLLVDMLTGMRGLTAGAVLKTLYRVKNLQTRTVTSMLQFLGPNAIRDTVSAAVLSKNAFLPVIDTMIGMGHVILKTPLYRDMRRQGAGYGTRIEARTEETRSRRQLDLPARNGWDLAAKFLAGYDRFTSAFEYGSRMGDYRRGMKASRTPLEAAWQAREITTDFSKIGRNEFWAKFIRTVPFMNASIQGIDKTAREFSEIDGKMTVGNLAKFNRSKAAFILKGGVITTMTLILWLLNKDDDRYKALTEDERARFWWIFVPGLDKPIKIPRPYDIGHIFATIPEIVLNLINDKDGEAAAKQMAWVALNSLAIGDYPGIFQPMIEVQANKDWRGAPIVPNHMLDMPARYQFTERTPQIYIALGETLGVSPLVAEHYAQGYLRYVEAYIADATEALFWKQDKWGDRPFQRGPVDYLIHQFAGQKVPYRTKWTEGYYDLKTRAAGMRQAFGQLQALAVKDKTRLDAFMLDKMNTQLVALDTTFGRIDAAFEDQNAFLMSVKYNPNLSRPDKEAQIEGYYEQKNDALAVSFKQIKAALDEVERSTAR